MRRFVLRSERPDDPEGEIHPFPNRYYLNGEHGVYLFQPEGLGDERETKFADTFNGSFLKTVSNKVTYSDFTATLVITPGSGGWWRPGILTRADWSSYSAYDVYNELLTFLYDAEEYGLHLGYQSNGRNYRDDHYSSTDIFPENDLNVNFFYSKVKFKSISKTELDVYGNLQCKIVFSRLAPWRRWLITPGQATTQSDNTKKFYLEPPQNNTTCNGIFFKTEIDLTSMTNCYSCRLSVVKRVPGALIPAWPVWGIDIGNPDESGVELQSIEYSCDPGNCYIRVNGSSFIDKMDLSGTIFPKNIPKTIAEGDCYILLTVGSNTKGHDPHISGDYSAVDMEVSQLTYYGSV